ncbi:MAG TPA: DNA polymerase I, partial [Candidatus Treponema faecavium]|nr:DNA polymerase I [Candidatus Treponema faecavium]
LSGSAKCLPKADVFAELSRLFLNPNITVVMHNGKFDYEVLMSNGFPRPVCRIADTMIAAWLLEPDRASFGLQQLSESRLGLETTAYGDIVPKGKTFADVPLEQAAAYAAEDADLTWQLWQLFSPELERNGLAELFTELEMPVLPVLAYMELAGIHIEKKELDAYGQELKKKLAELETEIHRLAGRPFNIASPKQLQEILFTELKLPAQKKTKTGYSTDTAVLENLKALHPVPAKILEYRMYAKLLSTYVETLPALADENGRIHTTFMQTGTATGRLSSRDPNLQNIPIREEAGRRIRQAFTASDGMALISADYSQIELVILAHLSQDRALCDAFRNGADVHRSTAALIFGVAEDQVLPEMRRTAKVINFGVMYGMSAFRLSNELGIPRTQASAFISQYFATYAGIRTFIEETVRRAEETGYVQTLYGRKRMIRNIHSKNKMEKAGAERIAVNTPIQGSAADIVKKAMLAVSALLARAYPQARLLLQVHDELIVECPEEQAAQAAQDIKDCMERAASLSVPLKVSVEYGARWGDFH